MLSAWTVRIGLIAHSNMSLISANIARQAASAQKSVGGLQAQLSKVGGAAQMADRAFVGLGIAAAAATAVGIRGASQMQTAIAGIAVTTGQTTQYVEQHFSRMALAISNATGVLSMSDAMDVVKSASVFIPNKRNLENPAYMTQLAKFADIQKMQHQIAIPESVADVGRVSHMLGAYSLKAMSNVSERLNRASFSTPDGIPKLTAQLAYFAEGYHRAGMTDDAVLNLGVLGDLSLGKGKWGNAYDTLLTNLVKPTKPQARRQEVLGIRDSHGALKSSVLDANRNVDVIKVMRTVNRNTEGRSLSGTEQMQLIAGGFNQAARRIVTMASSGKNLAFYDQEMKKQAHMGSIDQMQDIILKTLPNETARLTTAFGSLATLIDGPLTASLTTLVGKIADGTQGLANLAQEHPRIAGAIGYGAAALGAAALARISYKMVKAGHNFVHVFGTLGKHPHIGTGIGHAFGGRAATVAAEGAAVIAKRSLLGRVAVGAAGLLGIGGIKTLGGIRPLLAELPKLGELFTSFGLKTVTTRGGLMLLGEVVAKIGLRAIPIVGEVLMLADGINYLFHHSKDVGKGLVIATRWVITTGGPLLWSAFKGVIGGLLSAINPMNWINAGKGIMSGIREGMDEVNAKQVRMGGARVGLDMHPRPSTAGQLILPQPTLAGPRRERTREVHHHTHMKFEYHAPEHGDLASHELALLRTQRKLTDAVTESISKTHRTSGRAAGQTAGMSGMSGFEFAGAPG